MSYRNEKLAVYSLGKAGDCLSLSNLIKFIVLPVQNLKLRWGDHKVIKVTSHARLVPDQIRSNEHLRHLHQAHRTITQPTTHARNTRPTRKISSSPSRKEPLIIAVASIHTTPHHALDTWR